MWFLPCLSVRIGAAVSKVLARAGRQEEEEASALKGVNPVVCDTVSHGTS